MARAKVRRVAHHAAMAYADVPAFMSKLRADDGATCLALQFLILTATRTSEVLNATWGEIDLDAKVWRIPPQRMKAGCEHRVPLSDAALAPLTDLRRKGPAPTDNEWVFPGANAGRPLSNMAFLQRMDRMGHGALTVHGFRSSFRDWAAEQTNFPREVAEAALAHVLGDKVEAAYRRSDLFEKRRQLMQAWARYCGEPSAILPGYSRAPRMRLS